MNLVREFSKGLWRENAVFRLLLGLCPTLAVTTSAENGLGMGLAKVAELNRFPGPRHVLDLAPEMELGAGQRAETQAVFERMQARAQALGRAILAAEQALETAFAEGTIDADRLERLTDEIGRLQGELRNVHLRAHLDMKRILRPEQVARYDHLRGYAAH